jgi:hypothetical protein
MGTLSSGLDRAIARANRAFLADPKAVAGARAEGDLYRRRLEADGTLPPLNETPEADDGARVNLDEYSDGAFDSRGPACPACGDPIDYCQGHGEIGDPAGFAILAAHDDDDHSGCNPAGCDVAADAPVRWAEGFWDRQANR